MVRNGNGQKWSARFRWSGGAETVLVRRKEMVLERVTIELLVDSSFYDFGDDGDDGDWTIVGRVMRVSGF